jgi:hypothetical protein
VSVDSSQESCPLVQRLGHLPLEQVIGVRIPGGQPKYFPNAIKRFANRLLARVEGCVLCPCGFGSEVRHRGLAAGRGTLGSAGVFRVITVLVDTACHYGHVFKPRMRLPNQASVKQAGATPSRRRRFET